MTLPKSISNNKNLLSPSQVAEKLGVHRSTVHVWIKNGMLQAERHGIFLCVSCEELGRFRQIYRGMLPRRSRRRKGK